MILLNKTNNKKQKKHKIVGTFETAAVLNIHSQHSESKVAFPSEKAVIDAKDWVDQNEK